MYPRNDSDPADWATVPEPDWCATQETALLEAALPLAATLGWTDRLVRAAGRTIGLSEPEAELLLPGGPRDLAALLVDRHDTRMLAALAQIDPATLKVRDRIAVAVKARLDAAADDDAAVRRWAGYLALPHNVPLALGLAWRGADVVWRWAGDTATDENHYTKRAILGAILVSALATRLSQGPAAAETHVDRRIGDVMNFERWKAGIRPLDLARQVAGTLGRLRYGRG